MASSRTNRTAKRERLSLGLPAWVARFEDLDAREAVTRALVMRAHAVNAGATEADLRDGDAIVNALVSGAHGPAGAARKAAGGATRKYEQVFERAARAKETSRRSLARKAVLLLPEWVMVEQDMWLVSQAEDAYVAKALAVSYGCDRAPAGTAPARQFARGEAALKVLNVKRHSLKRRCAAAERAYEAFRRARASAR